MADHRRRQTGYLKGDHVQSSNFHHNGSRMASPLASSDAGSNRARRMPFHGLVICVTGLSKDARKQVQEATMRLGGQYSPDLHAECTHLVVQSFSGRKYEYALKHGLRRGLYVVTLAWFVNCVKKNERLDELRYDVRSFINNSSVPYDETPHIPRAPISDHLRSPVTPNNNEMKALSLATVQMPKESIHKDLITQGIFTNMCFYVDMESSNEFQRKIMEVVASEGGSFIDNWFIGSPATHIVCEGAFMLKYLGFNVNLVTPFWVMKSVKERQVQRLVQLSPDLARHVSVLLDFAEGGHTIEGANKSNKKVAAICAPTDDRSLDSLLHEREEEITAAKAAVRRRRGPHNQPCRSLPRPVTPSSLLENVCWSITEPPSSAHFYVERCDSADKFLDPSEFSYNVKGDGADDFTTRGDHSDAIYTRPMSESENAELVFKAPFLTILFPNDRFMEIGPSSRTFHNENGFCRKYIIENIWSFYQEHMKPEEIEVALYTDSKHADRLRAAYASKEAISLGYVPLKRYEFLGSRKCFEGLKRIGSDNTSHVYELLLAA